MNSPRCRQVRRGPVPARRRQVKGRWRCSFVGEAASVGVGILTSGKPTAVAAAALSLAESHKEAGGGVKATDANQWRYG
uniref:Uncharacterized protein n=1 Tax=Oryza glumipatula TaxID=40148 RepID=A0A0E0AU18_9ORYZ